MKKDPFGSDSRTLRLDGPFAKAGFCGCFMAQVILNREPRMSRSHSSIAVGTSLVSISCKLQAFMLCSDHGFFRSKPRLVKQGLVGIIRVLFVECVQAISEYL